MIDWPTNVNMKIRRESNWETPLKIIAQQTRCGRKKTRASGTCQPQTFHVTLKMSLAEKILFLNWFENSLGSGVESFGFPRIDDNSGAIGEYRFVVGSSIKWSNESGKVITASMEWEEA